MFILYKIRRYNKYIYNRKGLRIEENKKNDSINTTLLLKYTYNGYRKINLDDRYK